MNDAAKVKPEGKVSVTRTVVAENPDRVVPSNGGIYLSATAMGGQGKTLTAQIIALMLARSGAPYKLAAADKASSMADGKSLSKFGQLTPNVIELGVGPAVDDKAALKYWDRMVSLMLEPASVIDFGANVINNILTWARVSRASEVLSDSSITLVAPVTAQLKSARDVFDLVTLARAQEQQGGLRFSRIVVVLNWKDGDPLGDAETAGLIHQMTTTMGVRLATMEQGPDLVALMDKARKPLSWACKATREDIEKAFSLSLMDAHRERFGFNDWLEATVKSFAEAGIVAPLNPGEK